MMATSGEWDSSLMSTNPSLPASYYVPLEQRKLSDRFLENLSKRIPTHWEKVGTYLSVNAQCMDKLRAQSMNRVDSWGLGMLRMWAEYAEDMVDMAELFEALETIERNDLIEFVRGRLPEGQSLFKKDDSQIEILLEDLATKICNVWYGLGIELDIPSESLDIIKQNAAPEVGFNPARRMLFHWNQEFSYTVGKPARLDALKDALIAAGRNDVVTWIEERPKNGLYAKQSFKQPGERSATVSESSSSSSLATDFQNMSLREEPSQPRQERRDYDTVDNSPRQAADNLPRSPADNAPSPTAKHGKSGFEDGGSSDYCSATETLASQEEVELAQSVENEDKNIDLNRGRTYPSRKLEGRLTCNSIRSDTSSILPNRENPFD